MIPISDTLKSQFMSSSLHEIKGYFNDSIEIINNGDILNGGFVIERDAISGNTLEIGSAIAANLSLTILNYNHCFEDKLPALVKPLFKEGMELNFRIKPHGASESMSLGYFIVDKIEYKKDRIIISALDNMVKFDREIGVEVSLISSLIGYINAACAACGVTLANTSEELEAFANSRLIIPSLMPESKDIITYRLLIIWACQLMGVNAFIDWNGQLRLVEYPPISSSAPEISKSNRFSSDFGTEDIEISGIVYTDNKGVKYISGESGYVLSLENNTILNGFTDAGKQMAVNTLREHIINDLSAFRYIPFSASILSMPWLMPMDRVKLVDYNGNIKDSLITNTVYKLNTMMDVEAKGESSESHSYSSTGAFTASQQTILNNMSYSKIETGTLPDSSSYKIINYSDGTRKAFLEKTISGIATSSGGLYVANVGNLNISELGFSEVNFVSSQYYGLESGSYQYPDGFLIFGKPTSTEIPNIKIVALSVVSSLEYGKMILCIEGK